MSRRTAFHIRDHALQRHSSSRQTVLRFRPTGIVYAAFANGCPNRDGLPGSIYGHDIKGSTLPSLVNPSGLNMFGRRFDDC
jgi:hypothetical protein